MECQGKTGCVFNLTCKGRSSFDTSQGGHSHKHHHWVIMGVPLLIAQH